MHHGTNLISYSHWHMVGWSHFNIIAHRSISIFSCQWRCRRSCGDCQYIWHQCIKEVCHQNEYVKEQHQDAIDSSCILIERIFETNVPTLNPEPRSLLQVCMNLNGDKLKTWASSDLETAVDLLQKCLTVDCNERITAKDALQHPFLQLSSSSPQPSNT